MKSTIAKNFALLREQLGLSQQQMADYLGVASRESISQYENSHRDIPLSVLESCANLFGVELLDFFEEDDSKVRANMHFAFRAAELNSHDLMSISKFKKLIGNYLRMTRIKTNE